MYEAGTISTPIGDGTNEAALRIPAWEELVARLAAARDLRATLAVANRARGGSFAHLADPVNAGKEAINQPGLADGKAGAAMVRTATYEAADYDRGTQ